MLSRTFPAVALLCVLCGTHAADFVTVDPDTGLFRQGKTVFAAPCVTYVQPAVGVPGANSGETQLLFFDLTRITEDFRHMRAAGVRAIYMRLGTGFLLNQDGTWRRPEDPYTGVWKHLDAEKRVPEMLAKAAAAGIGPFATHREIFNYFLSAAGRAGIYVIPAVMDSWSMPRKYERNELMAAFAYPDQLGSLCRDWATVTAAFKGREEILGWLIEGEMFHLTPWNDTAWSFLTPEGPAVLPVASAQEGDDAGFASQWQAFLRQRHGSIGTLRQRLATAYDYSRPEYRERIPFYPWVQFAARGTPRQFADIPLPSVEREAGAPATGIEGLVWWTNVPRDPFWIEFGYFREYLNTCGINAITRSLRQGDPNHLVLYSAAADGLAVSHPFLTTWGKGDLECDVILHGGGYMNSGTHEPPDIGTHEGHLELYQTVGTHRPFTWPAVSGRRRAFGMGEGGCSLESNDQAAAKTLIPETFQSRWVAGILMDNFGSGAALANIWDWGTLTGATATTAELHDHEALARIKAISDLLERDPFPARAPAVLILLDGPVLHSLIKEVDYANLIVLTHALTHLNIPFDVVSSDEISGRAQSGKVSLDRYQVILIPEQMLIATAQLAGNRELTPDAPEQDPWRLLGAWLEAEAGRTLIAGIVGHNTPWFSSLDALPASVRAVLGNISLSSHSFRSGNHMLHLTAGPEVRLGLSGTPVQTVTPPANTADVNTAATLYSGAEDVGSVATQRLLPNGSRALCVGFPLGLSWTWCRDPELAGSRVNEVLDVKELAKLLGLWLAPTGVQPEYAAPSGITAYISATARGILARQRYGDGPRSNITLASRRLGGWVYANSVTECQWDGREASGRVTFDLDDDLAACLTGLATVQAHSPGTVKLTVSAGIPQPEGWVYEVTIEGDSDISLEFADKGAHAAVSFRGAERSKRLTVYHGADSSWRIDR